MKNNNIDYKTVEFIPLEEGIENYIEPPIPSAYCIPQWYKKTKKDLDQKNNIPDSRNRTIKSCVPIFDSMSSGYIQKSWAPINVKKQDGVTVLESLSNKYELTPFSMRVLKAQGEITAPHGYSNRMYNFKRPWIPKTPPGYSTLYTHPFYHTDLPFLVLPGIVDSDVFQAGGHGSPPFFLQEDFEGLIETGTPLYQIIFIKRENWKAEILKDRDCIIESIKKLESLKKDRYKKIFWIKKRTR